MRLMLVAVALVVALVLVVSCGLRIEPPRLPMILLPPLVLQR
jgi:hypothetical protein